MHDRLDTVSLESPPPGDYDTTRWFYLAIRVQEKNLFLSGCSLFAYFSVPVHTPLPCSVARINSRCALYNLAQLSGSFPRLSYPKNQTSLLELRRYQSRYRTF